MKQKKQIKTEKKPIKGLEMLKTYFFPRYGISFKAVNLKEANIKLEQHLKKGKKL